MSDKIMPMSAAVEGYDLFDKMKVQKGMPPTIINVRILTRLTRPSGFRSTEVKTSRSLLLHRMKDGRP